MNVQIVRGAEVARPQPAALTSSVLDHATVGPDLASFGLRSNDGLWPSYNCLDLLIPTQLCPEVDLAPKSFVNAEWVPGFEFSVYGGTKCSMVGLDINDQIAETKRVFEASAGKGIEMALLANRFVATDSDAPVQWEAPVDLGSAPSLLSAIGKMEGYAAANYVGIPTLHVPRAVITMGFGQGALVERDGKFYTKAGSKVAAGGGYDDPTPPQSGTMDLYVTGEVFVERSEEISQAAYVVPGDGNSTDSEGTGLEDNTHIVLVERMYRVGIDCLLAKVEGTVWA